MLTCRIQCVRYITCFRRWFCRELCNTTCCQMWRSLNIRCRVCSNASARMQQTGKLRRPPRSHQTFARAYFPTWAQSGMHACSAYANDENPTTAVVSFTTQRKQKHIRCRSSALQRRWRNMCNSTAKKSKTCHTYAKSLPRFVRWRRIQCWHVLRYTCADNTSARSAFNQSKIIVNVACHGRVASHRWRRMRS